MGDLKREEAGKAALGNKQEDRIGKGKCTLILYLRLCCVNSYFNSVATAHPNHHACINTFTSVSIETYFCPFT